MKWFDRAIIVGWYDGPTAGITLDEALEPWCFWLVAELATGGDDGLTPQVFLRIRTDWETLLNLLPSRCGEDPEAWIDAMDEHFTQSLPNAGYDEWERGVVLAALGVGDALLTLSDWGEEATPREIRGIDSDAARRVYAAAQPLASGITEPPKVSADRWFDDVIGSAK